jgi:hypothetical protein
MSSWCGAQLKKGTVTNVTLPLSLHTYCCVANGTKAAFSKVTSYFPEIRTGKGNFSLGGGIKMVRFAKARRLSAICKRSSRRESCFIICVKEVGGQKFMYFYV